MQDSEREFWNLILRYEKQRMSLPWPESLEQHDDEILILRILYFKDISGYDKQVADDDQLRKSWIVSDSEERSGRESVERNRR